MQLTLFESDRSFLRSAECVALSIVAHLAVVWLAVASTTGGRLLPTTERDARVFFLLPPDRVDVGERQVDIPRPGKLGSGLDEAQVPGPSEGLALQAASTHARRKGARSGPRLDLPVSPTPYVPDSVYSVLQVDQMVERFESSAAPVYPPELAQRGTEGQVEATYVVDTTGRVDTSTFHVLRSDDSLFTESVRTALAEMHFRPAKRAGKAVRQLVAQRFRFRLAQQQRPVDGSW
jgi:TonB family protein